MNNYKDQCVTITSIKDKVYKVFFERGDICQIQSVGGKSISYIDIKGKNGIKIAKLAYALAQ